ncbi:MAG TPA: M20/M25/M40 family metallo-hydrolase, partial [Verrucomicrobiae bacterium]|nr:M20/M25/M40 family metallo-hydrolase [Verrucomicrobiae bacterium]
TQPNIVPDRCSIVVDRRTLPGETESGVKKEIKKLLDAHELRARCLDDKLAPCRPLETSPAHPLVARLLNEAGQSKPGGVDYFSDAAVLAEGGIPSVVFGPGDIAQAHTCNEWVEVAQVEKAKALLSKFLRSLP